MIHIVAAIMVIVGHQFALMDLGQNVQILGRPIHEMGVRILFLVSASFLRSSSIGKYLIKRLARIYPPLLLCLIITVLFMRLVTNNAGDYWESALKYFLYNLEMRPKFDLVGCFDNNPYAYAVNGSLWTLPIELALYFVLIVFIMFIKSIDRYNKYGKYIFSLALLFILSWIDVYYVNLQGKSLIIWYTDWARAIILAIYFFIGVIFQILNLRKICNWQLGVAVVIHMCLPSLIQYVMTPYLTAYIVMCFALAERPLFSNLFKKDICYGLYLYAFPIQQIVIYFFMVKLSINCSVYVLLVISLFLTIIFAKIQYWLIEENGFYRNLKKLKKG